MLSCNSCPSSNAIQLRYFAIVIFTSLGAGGSICNLEFPPCFLSKYSSAKVSVFGGWIVFPHQTHVQALMICDSIALMLLSSILWEETAPLPWTVSWTTCFLTHRRHRILVCTRQYQLLNGCLPAPSKILLYQSRYRIMHHNRKWGLSEKELGPLIIVLLGMKPNFLAKITSHMHHRRE